MRMPGHSNARRPKLLFILIANKKTAIILTAVCILYAVSVLHFSSCATSGTRLHHGISTGEGFFYFKDKAISTGSAMRVFYYKPKEFTADRPILFFMHGADRKAAHIPKIAADVLEKCNILLILPEFSEELFPKVESYQYGSVRTKPKELWSFYVNDRIFQFVRQNTGTRQQKYHIWGNSAGAQFVHRQLLVGAHEHIEKAFASNAGVYTLPAMKQGSNRLQRGKLFYATAQKEARERGLEFNWQLITIPGCGHEPDDNMLGEVIRIILTSQN